MQRRTLAAQFSLGALHMAAFGLGTVPMLLGVALLGGKLRLLTMHAHKVISFSVALVAMLLIVRGMGLAIPYLSPALNESACH